MAMLRWVYTDELELTEDDTFLIDLMKLANRFQLQLLRERSVSSVASSPIQCNDMKLSHNLSPSCSCSGIDARKA